MPRSYDAAWMYDVRNAWATAPSSASAPSSSPRWLRGLPPKILNLQGETVDLGLPLPPIAGPRSLGAPASAKVFNTFNPAIVPAPRNLCPRCAYVVALRADALHQCNRSSPLIPAHVDPKSHKKPKPIATGAWFKGTAIVVLDSGLAILGWTWMLPRPEDQVTLHHNLSRWYVRPGVSDGFLPPWGKPAYDTRLLNLDGERLFATSNCKACTFSIAQLEVTATPTADGGLRDLRVWSRHRIRAFPAWAQGRNQALFSLPVPASVGGGGEGSLGAAAETGAALLVQPWLGLVASFGVPSFRTQAVPRCYSEQASFCPHGETPECMDAAIRKLGRKTALRLAGTGTCGPMPVGAPLNASVLQHRSRRPMSKRAEKRRHRRAAAASSHLHSSDAPTNGSLVGWLAGAAKAPPEVQHPTIFGSLELIANHTALERRRRTFDIGRHRVSPTANLVRIEGRGRRGGWGGAGRGGVMRLRAPRFSGLGTRIGARASSS
jgi:hypothetical protein